MMRHRNLEKVFEGFVERLKDYIKQEQPDEQTTYYNALAQAYANYQNASTFGDYDYNNVSLNGLMYLTFETSNYVSIEDLDYLYTNNGNVFHALMNTSELKLRLSRLDPPQEEVEYF